jgi:hypothetical protein
LPEQSMSVVSKGLLLKKWFTNTLKPSSQLLVLSYPYPSWDKIKDLPLFTLRARTMPLWLKNNSTDQLFYEKKLEWPKLLLLRTFQKWCSNLSAKIFQKKLLKILKRLTSMTRA